MSLNKQKDLESCQEIIDDVSTGNQKESKIDKYKYLLKTKRLLNNEDIDEEFKINIRKSVKSIKKYENFKLFKDISFEKKHKSSCPELFYSDFEANKCDFYIYILGAIDVNWDDEVDMLEIEKPIEENEKLNKITIYRQEVVKDAIENLSCNDNLKSIIESCPSHKKIETFSKKDFIGSSLNGHIYFLLAYNKGYSQGLYLSIDNIMELYNYYNRDIKENQEKNSKKLAKVKTKNLK